MLSTKLARVAHRTYAASTTTTSIPIPTTASTASHRAPQCLVGSSHSRQHQRRHSSSKASSCPPENSASGGKPAPTAKGTAAGVKDSLGHAPSQQRSNRKPNRPKRLRSATGVDKAEDQFAGLPAVPGTQHLSHTDFSVSSFFSLHRPLSISTTIPPIAPANAFDRVFDDQQPRDPWKNGNSAEGRPEDTVYALRTLFEDLDATSNEAQDEGVRWDVMTENGSMQDGMKHLDAPPTLKTLDEIVANFKPFQAPPAPVPFSSESSKSAETKKASKPRQKRYATTLFLTESTSESGQTTYTASTSPIVRLPEEHVAIRETLAEDGHGRVPFIQRLGREKHAYYARVRKATIGTPSARGPVRRAPSAARRGDRMMLISVKRQRKLKMKKHKYKKLMKRTRTLRRRQDRG